MDKTPNINLNKPSRSVRDWDTLLNQNFDILDTELKNKQTSIDSLNSSMAENVQQISTINTQLSDINQQKANKTYTDTQLALKADKAEVNTLATEKANQTDLDTQKSRIDNLVANNGSQTVGNAELIDIRFGADGITYANAGNAVRQQITKINNELHDLDSTLRKGVLDNKNDIEVNKESIKNANDKLNDFVTMRDIAVTDENGNIISTENSDELNGSKYTVICDDTLSSENVPADAKAVGEQILELDLTTRKGINDNKYDITQNRNEIKNINDKLSHYTTTKDITITDGNENVLTTENGYGLNGLKYFLICDETLSNESIPADAKATGEQISNLDNKFSFKYQNVGLPVLYLNGDTTGMSKDIKKTLSYKYGNLNGSCTAKWQGSSSIAYPKKNYTITFDSEFEAKYGWGKQKKYCLKANWIDFSHARNIVSSILWGETVHDREKLKLANIVTELEDALLAENNDNLVINVSVFYPLINGGAIDGFPVFVVINGVYQGLYTFNIPKDKWLFGMTNSVTEYIVTSEVHGSATQFRSLALADGSDFAIEYAKDGVPQDTVKASLNRAINSVINAQNGDFTEVEKYLDINSAIDYYIFSSLLTGVDMTDKNYILVSYDGVKWYFSAYDMDTTYGNHWEGKSYYTTFQTPTMSNYSHLLMELIKNHKSLELKNRYNALRESVLSESNVLYKFSNYLSNIPMIVKNEEVKTWTNIPGTESNNLAQIINYYRLRCNFIDQELTTI